MPYDVDADPYTDKVTGILQNLLGISSQDKLDNLKGENIHNPIWIPLAQLEDLTLYPTQIKKRILVDTQNRFNDAPQLLRTD